MSQVINASAIPNQRPSLFAISGRTLISFGLGVVFYFSLKAGYYFLHNRMQELGFLIAICLFVYSALLAALNVRKPDLHWSFWVFAYVLFIGYIMVLPAYLFGSHAGVSMVPSVMASREFIIAILAPTLWFLYRIGYEVERIEKVFMVTAALVVISYIFHYFRLDLRSAYFSSDPTIAGMVTYDEWRGYRLKAPGMALMLTSITAPYLMVKAKGYLEKLFWLIAFLFCCYAWFLIKSRGATAMLIVGVFLYHFWFARKERLGLLFLAIPVLIPFLYYSTGEYFKEMEFADEGVRFKSYMIAWNSIQEHPLFGFGIGSAATVTEQELFWEKFYSADIGVVGITFKYGIVGTLLYFAFEIGALVKAVRSNWAYRQRNNMVNILFVAAAVKLVGDTLKFLLSIDYMYIEGVTLISVILALSAIYKHKFANESGASVTANAPGQ